MADAALPAQPRRTQAQGDSATKMPDVMALTHTAVDLELR
jgi:hypothetical protein